MTDKEIQEIAVGEGERLDRVNDDIMLIQKTEGLTFGTDALLLSAFIEGHSARALEIGGGTGIISLLALKRGKFDTVDSCEVQEDFAELIKRNAELNALRERLTVHFSDIRTLAFSEQFDAVFTNPPYMKTTSGKSNLDSSKNIARHEVHGGIDDFCLAAQKMLKFGGKFYAVYRTDRLPDLIFSMRSAKIEPKRMTLVHADKSAIPSIVLIEGRMGGGTGTFVTQPLIIYNDKEHKCESDDMKYILENGCFPDAFLANGKTTRSLK